MKFQVLGNVEVHDGDQLIQIPTARARTLLAGLLVNANRVVTIEKLAEILWGDQPPKCVRSSVQLNTVRLRQALGRSAHEVIQTRPGGYLIKMQPDQLDLLTFRSLVTDGHSAVQPTKRSELLRSALDLWRGRPLSDLSSDVLRRDVVPQLVDEYLAACEQWAEVELDLGRPGNVIPVLRTLTREHPESERAWGQLMLALYRSGRQVDALEAYRTLYRYLDDCLGVQPGWPLRALHEQILRADPELDNPPVESAPTVRDPTRKPQQLPASIARLRGREEHVRLLDQLLWRGDALARPSAAVVVISGPAGVGKTALASFWARRVQGDFEDGQVFVNLNGFGSTGKILAPGEALRYILEGLGITADQMPSDPTSQITLYRSLLAGKRVLLVLDDAHNAQQVRALLPSSPGCVAVVTSRRQLPSLVATEGALLLPLDELHEHDARSLLADRVGADRIAAETVAVDAIITACSRLPLSLAIVASQAAYRPSFSLRELADNLAGDGLDAFASEDPRTDLRSVLQSSYGALTPESARIFRLLALRFGSEIGVAAAASLAGLESPSARDRLRELAGLHLVTERRPARYELSSLLHAYAAELAHSGNTEQERRQAVDRLLNHYLHSVHAAAHLLHPQRYPTAIGIAHTGVTVEPMVSVEAALAWFDREYPALLEAVEQAGAMGLRVGDLRAQIHTLRNLGVVNRQLR